MKRPMLILIAMIFSAVSFCSFQGCTIQYVVSQATPVPYPNAWRVEMRVRAQIDRINSGLQQNILGQETADFLAGNDALIRRYLRDFQGPADNRVDLNVQEADLLNGMLNDNDRYIDDAFQRNQSWAYFFQNGDYDYQSSDHFIYIASLDYRLRQQDSSVNDGLKSGSLTRSQAQDLHGRIQTIRGLEQNCFRTNGRFDLSQEQVAWISRLVEGNGRYLRFRLKGNRGRWSQDLYSSWKKQIPTGLGKGGNGQWGRRQNYTGAKPTQVPYTPPSAPTFTPVPVIRPVANTPTSTPVPQQAQAVPTSTPTSRPLVPTSTNTAPPAQPTATYTSQPVAAPPSPTFTPRAVAPAWTPTQVAVNNNQSPAQPTSTPVPVQATVKLLPYGKLVSLLSHADNTVRKALKSGQLTDDQGAALDQKLKNLHQRADDDLKKNGANGVTVDQMQDLTSLSDDIDRFIQGVLGSGKDRGQEGEDNGSKDEKKKDRGQGHGHGDD